MRRWRRQAGHAISRGIDRPGAALGVHVCPTRSQDVDVEASAGVWRSTVGVGGGVTFQASAFVR